MPLTPGSRLGPYEILSAIGAGGMGEVYRAKDPRLGRDVAIKVLPPSFSADADRLRRFEQEAKAAGVLNHPNITAVYDIGTHEGAPYVVQELLEGETLRSLLSGGKLSTRRAIDYSLQIVHGLAAAHEKGIVHRDLKPDNLFITNDGRVKILDFGLAKLTHTEDRGLQATSLPTATQGTEPGVVMGTLGYMSPEQVRGRQADARSDIFSFGAILYEMLSGRRAFYGDSAADTMSAILKEDPPDLSVTNQSVPPGLDRIVRHCLEKNPEQRFHSAHDVAFDLEALSGASAPRLETSKARPRFRVAVPVLAAAVLGAVAAGIYAGRWIWKPAPASSPTYQRITFRRGPIFGARFAPDGHTVVYSAAWDGARATELYSTRLESPESSRLNLPRGQVEAISRTGEMLVLTPLQFSGGFTRKGTLWQAPISGSSSRDLLEDVGSADWSPDGASIAVARAPEWRFQLEYPVGKVLYETAGWISDPRISPKGDLIAFFDHPVFGDDRGGVAVIDLQGKKETLAEGLESSRGLAWSLSGDEVWFSATRTGNAKVLYAVTLDGRERTVLRTPAGVELLDLSRDGRALLLQSTARLGILAILPGEAKEKDLSGFDWSFGPRLSEDAKMIAFTEQGEAGGPGYSVYLRKLDGSAAVRLGEGIALAISPDGKWILSSQVRTTPGVLVLLPIGAGQPKTFPKDSIDRSGAWFGGFLPDGKGIAFVGHEPGKPTRVFVQDLEGGPARPVTAEGVTARLLSPDGRFLVVQIPGQAFGLAPLAGGPIVPIPGIDARERPARFTADGRSLFVGSPLREMPARIYRVEIATGRRETWKEFTPGDLTGITNVSTYGISADGNTVIFTYGHNLSDLYVAEGLK